MNKSPSQPLSSKKVFFLMGFTICAFAYVILKDNPLPKLILLAGALLGVVTFFMSGFFSREVMTYVLTAYLPFSRQIPGDFLHVIPGMNLTNALIAVVTILWLKERDKDRSLFWAKIPFHFSIYAFLFVAIISVIRGFGLGFPYLVDSFTPFFRRWLVPFYLYFLFLNSIRDKQEAKNVVLVIMMTVTMIALMAFYEAGEVEGRVRGVLNQSNMQAAFFAYFMFLPFCFFLVNMKKIRYWIFLVPVLLCFRGIMVTSSRAGYLAFLTGVYGVIFFRNKLLFLMLILATWFIFQNPAFLPEAIRYRLGQTIEKPTVEGDIKGVSKETLDKSVTDRFRLWEAAKWMIRENPLLGGGYDSFVRKSLHYWPGRTSEDPHNSYLLIAAEMGIPALLLYLWMLIRAGWNSLLLYQGTEDRFIKASALGLMGGIFALLMSNMYGSRVNYTELSAYFWILVALIMRFRIFEGTLNYDRVK